jgi:hypothetical protein
VSDGRVAEARFVPTQSFCFRDLSADITGKALQEVIGEVCAACSPGDVVRITFTGSGVLDGLLRTEPEDVARTICSSSGCTVKGMRVLTGPESSPGPIADKVASKAEELAALPRQSIMEILMSKTMLKPHRAYFESLSDDEFYGMVRGAAGLAVSAMGGRR